MTTTLGYTIFTVEDVGETLTFFQNAFGFPRRMLTPENDYGELETGETTLAFVSASLAQDNLGAAGGIGSFDPNSPPLPASITLTTPDVDDVLTRAIEYGATSYVPPVDKPWGQRVAYLRDPNGILLEIATPVGN